MIGMWVTLIIYLFIMVGVGFYYKKKNDSVSEFVLGGRTLGPWFTAFAYGTSYFSAVIFVGYAGKFGWNFGLASTWIGIGNAILGSLLPWLILGRRSRVMSKALEAKTMPEFFEKRYNSKMLKLISAGIIFVFLIPYTTSVYNGLSHLFEKEFGIPYEYCIIGMAVITAFYVIIGGYKATALTDFIQGIFMLIGITAIVIAVLRVNGGLVESVKLLGEIPDQNGNTGVYNSIMGADPANLIGVIILTSLGTWGLPQMVSKFYAVKDDKSIKIGAIVSTVFAIVVAGGCYFLGGFGRFFVPENEGNPVGGFDLIMPTMMEMLSPVIFAIVIILVLSASMSTLSSLVLTSSSVLTIDLIKPLCKVKMTEKKELTVLRILIGLFVLISVVLAFLTLHNPNTIISTLMSISWGALAGAFLAPYLYGLFWKGVTKTAVISCFICGVGITIAHMIYFTLGNRTAMLGSLNLASPINAGAFSMLFGLVLVPIVSLITRNKAKDKQHIEEVFTSLTNKN